MTTKVTGSVLANTAVTAATYGGNQLATFTVDAQGRLTSAANVSSSLFFTDGTNVGVGTSSPGSILDVQSTTSIIRNTATTGTNQVAIRQGNTGGYFYTGIDTSAGGYLTGVAYAGFLWMSGAYPMIFATSNGEKMRLDSSGNLGIGTISPSYKLDVQGGNIRNLKEGSQGGLQLFTYSSNQTYNAPRIETWRARGTAASPTVVTSGDELFSLQSSGYNASAGWTYAGGIFLYATGTISGANVPSYMTFETNSGASGSEKMRLDSSGNLLVGTTSASTPSTTGFISTANTFGFKNRIINGAMVIDQRNAGASGTAIGYTVDRWQFNSSLATKGTWQQNAGSVTPPAGFTKYLGFTSNSAYTVAAGDYFAFTQAVEGFNVADLAWGTANAATVTLSFWVRSSLTGTFGGAITNLANNRAYPFSYSVGSANTWTQISVQIAGDTTGTWQTNNTTGLVVNLAFGVGSTYSGTAGAWAGANYVSATGATSVVGTNGATFYITGVQLEKGSTATSFDYRPYGTELALCQRYYYRTVANNVFTPFMIGVADSATNCYGCQMALPVTMRTAPTVNFSNIRAYDGTVVPAITAISNSALTSSTMLAVSFTSAGGMTVGRAVIIQANNNTSGYVDASSEL